MLHNGSLCVSHINLQFAIGPSNAAVICNDVVADIAMFLELTIKCQSWLSEQDDVGLG